MKKKYFTIIIEDISEGDTKGYAVTLPALHNSIVLGENFAELAKGLRMTFEAENKKCDPSLLQALKEHLEAFRNSRKNLNSRTGIFNKNPLNSLKYQ